LKKNHCPSDVGAEAEDTVFIYEILVHWFLSEVHTGAAEIVENREIDMIDLKSRVDFNRLYLPAYDISKMIDCKSFSKIRRNFTLLFKILSFS
jgi:hypothetical protein